ncbi:maleylpyruvate isomerase N-terminal domain-containing protein [Nonomuraea sp. MCN248]|uniref:Maleylpyruvate isomerase N-terminal domain-containing protein n=1 Tax=Nonomuraea corallina TaxID=2989783 RepID=A0ABT4S690_9ACTN|nr:maleylpyruvate isomerase N-terminal domain-containing protein [Nonomuraea corallina]MDA0632709.1 maleylpyruvate isomerase N-terminal domain-containing protein [Nonomuraea corallina]
MEIRRSYLTAAESAVALLRDPSVAAAWAKPSALIEFSVAGLAGHLANQFVRVDGLLKSADEAAGEPVTLLEHYSRSPWVQAGLDHESNVSIRRGGEQVAADGPTALADRAAELLESQRRALPAQPSGRVVHLPWAGWSLTLDDFLLTRVTELVVHSDDLAASVGVPTPELPADVVDPVVDLLARLAVRRHGATAVIRTLSRAERSPATISAF